MTPQSFAVVGLKLLSIFLFVQVGSALSESAVVSDFYAKLEGPRTTLIFVALAPGLVLLLFSVLLFVFADPISRRLVPPRPDPAMDQPLTRENVEAIAFAAVGILILAMALPTSVRTIESLYQFESSSQPNDAATQERAFQEYSHAAAVLGQVVLGTVLLLSPRGFRNAWHWLRTAGTFRQSPR